MVFVGSLAASEGAAPAIGEPITAATETQAHIPQTRKSGDMDSPSVTMQRAHATPDALAQANPACVFQFCAFARQMLGTLNWRHESLSPASGNSERKPGSLAAQTPRSVMKPVTRREGVTSKPG